MSQVYNPYEKYGLRRVVNAATCMTMLGGSISPPEVFRAMEDASKSFVHIPELQHWAGKKIAEATGAEAGLPTAGASNGIMLAAAACISVRGEYSEAQVVTRLLDRTTCDIAWRKRDTNEGPRANARTTSAPARIPLRRTP